MLEQYLEIAIRITQENWPLIGTVMLFLVMLLVFRVGRHSRLAAKGVQQLNSKVDELQNILEELKGNGSSSVVSGVVSDGFATENSKEAEAENVLDAFAKACQPAPPQEVKLDVPEENVALAMEEFSFDGNLAVDQPEFPQQQEEQAAVEMPQPKEETKPAPAAPGAEKKDRNVVQCASCGNKLAYKGEWSGKKVKCPSCKDVVPLP
jgi:hypothetical protein